MTTEAETFLQRATLAVERKGTLPASAEVPEIESADQRAAFDALAHRIYDGLAGPPENRARSAAGQLASMLWQRVAEWDDRARPDDDD